MEEKIKEILHTLIAPTGISVDTIETQEVLGQQVFNIISPQGNKLIGTKGETARALDYLVKKIAEQKGEEELLFLVDINGYRLKEIEHLQNKARMMAARAKSFEYDVELTPMTAYERLIVHTTLQEEDGITTESLGEGRERRVVIKCVATENPL